MPLITRRSSTRALPRVSVGRCGLIFENCAFVSQNWSRLIYASFSEAVNHATTFVPTLLWVRTLRWPLDETLAYFCFENWTSLISPRRRASDTKGLSAQVPGTAAP